MLWIANSKMQLHPSATEWLKRSCPMACHLSGLPQKYHQFAALTIEVEFEMSNGKRMFAVSRLLYPKSKALGQCIQIISDLIPGSSNYLSSSSLK